MCATTLSSGATKLFLFLSNFLSHSLDTMKLRRRARTGRSAPPPVDLPKKKPAKKVAKKTKTKKVRKNKARPKTKTGVSVVDVLPSQVLVGIARVRPFVLKMRACSY